MLSLVGDLPNDQTKMRMKPNILHSYYVFKMNCAVSHNIELHRCTGNGFKLPTAQNGYGHHQIGQLHDANHVCNECNYKMEN